jgi:hypothetical protein
LDSVDAKPHAGGIAKKLAEGDDWSGYSVVALDEHGSSGKPGAQPIPGGVEVRVAGDILRAWRTGELAPTIDPSSGEVAEAFLLWLERSLPARKLVSVDELGVLYSAYCSLSGGRERYPLNPTILKHLATKTKKRQRDVHIGDKLHRNRVHYLVGPCAAKNHV